MKKVVGNTFDQYFPVNYLLKYILYKVGVEVVGARY